MKNKWLIALLAAFMCLFTVACADDGSGTSSVKESVSTSENGEKESAETVDYSTYGSFWMRGHDYKTMPVAVYNALPNMRSGYTYDYLANAESTIKAYSEAGVNALYGLYELCTLKGVETALDLCYDRNIAYLVNMGDAANLADSSAGLHNLDRVKYHDAFAGVMASDEPGEQCLKISASRSPCSTVISTAWQTAFYGTRTFFRLTRRKDNFTTA